MYLASDEILTARAALEARAEWAAAHGFFWLSERDMRMLERLRVSGYLTPADVRHLRAVLMRVGGPDNEALERGLAVRG